MRLKRGIMFNLAALLITAGYLVLAGMNMSDRRRSVRCESLCITVEDSAVCGFVTPRIAEQWLEEASLGIRSRRLNDIDLDAIEAFLGGNDYVSGAKVYVSMDGAANMILRQRHPVIRIISETGYDFYADSSSYLFPPCGHYAAEVPVVTGKPRFSFDGDFYGSLAEKKAYDDMKFLKKLINFVGIISNDEFLRSLVVQVYVEGDGQIELVPRIGDQVILVGRLENCGEKLTNLKEFYTQSFSDKWWETARQVDLRYRGQVIVR